MILLFAHDSQRELFSISKNEHVRAVYLNHLVAFFIFLIVLPDISCNRDFMGM